MFKFIHAADFHLDSPLRGLERYEGVPADEIRGASRRALENLVELALEERVAFVVVAGDLWDAECRDHRCGLYLAAQMGRLRAAGVQVVVVAGNHDAGSQIVRALRLCENVRLLSSKEPETVRFEDLDVAVVGQSFASRSVSQDLATSFPTADPALFTVGLLHTSLDGREGHADYAPCKLPTLHSKGYGYWALGHVHNREIVSEAPHVLFAGTIQGRHAKETGPKGCTLIAVENGQVTKVSEQTLDVVRWSDCRVDVSEAVDGDDAIALVRRALEDELAGADGRLLAVRVRLSGPTRAHGAVRGRPELWIDQVRALGADLAPGALWVEKVLLETRPAADLAAALERDDALGGLLASIQRIEASRARLAEYAEMLKELRSKLPGDLFDPESDPAPWEPESLKSTLDRVKDVLVARLLDEGAQG